MKGECVVVFKVKFGKGFVVGSKYSGECLVVIEEVFLWCVVEVMNCLESSVVFLVELLLYLMFVDEFVVLLKSFGVVWLVMFVCYLYEGYVVV